MNIVTAQLTPLMPILSENPITKPEFVKRAQETSVRKGIINLLELIDFQHAFTNGKEIVLQ